MTTEGQRAWQGAMQKMSSSEMNSLCKKGSPLYSTLPDFSSKPNVLFLISLYLDDAVDVRNSKATVEADKAMILAKIEEIDGGSKYFNEVIREKLKGWLGSKVTRIAIRKAPGARPQKKKGAKDKEKNYPMVDRPRSVSRASLASQSKSSFSDA